MEPLMTAPLAAIIVTYNSAEVLPGLLDTLKPGLLAFRTLKSSSSTTIRVTVPPILPKPILWAFASSALVATVATPPASMPRRQSCRRKRTC